MESSINTILIRDVHCILGLPFDLISMSETKKKVTSAIASQQSCFLSTPNLNFAMASQTDSDFFNSVIDSDLSVADGMPLIWVAKLLGIPITERVAGSSLFDALSQQKDLTKKVKVFFFGGQEGGAGIAHQWLNKTSSAMESCGFYDSGFVSVDDMSSPNIIDAINKAYPDFLVVALGAKKGQQWIQKNRKHLNAHVISHLGAVINFVAGHVERAPLFWQRCGLEWVWRIKQEPSLWRRYFFDGLAFGRLLLLKVLPLAIYDRCLRRSTDFNKLATMSHFQSDKIVITLSGSLHYANLTPIKQKFDELLQQQDSDVVLTCSQLVYIDGAFIATLLLFQRYLNEQGRQLILMDLSKRIRRLLNLNNVLNRFHIMTTE